MDQQRKNVIGAGGILCPEPSYDSLWEPEPITGSFYQTIMASAKQHLQQAGDWQWIKDNISGEVIMASEAEPWAKKFAIVLKKFGFQYGDGLHIVIGNSNLCFVAQMGAWILGGFVSCGDPLLDSLSISSQLFDLKAKIVLCLPENADKVLEARRLYLEKMGEKSDVGLEVLCLGSHSGTTNILDHLDGITPEELANDAPVAVDVKDAHKEVLVVFWSSGTTGLPKGICHSHFSTLNFVGELENDELPLSKVVSSTCFFHFSGFSRGFRSLRKRQYFHHLVSKNLRCDILLKLIIEEKPQNIVLANHHYLQLSQSNIFDDVDPKLLESVESIFPPGAAVPLVCEQKLRQKLPNLKKVQNNFGQTETGAAARSAVQNNLGCILSKVRIKIVDLESGEVCKPHQQGEICVRTQNMMLEYLNHPKETAEFFDADGFGRTGDMGFYDEDGCIYYVDRLKALINYNSYRVAPTELEDILQRHPAVQECLVFGKQDRLVNQLISAVVVLKPGNEASVFMALSIRSFVNDTLQIDYKKIRGPIIFRSEIPRSSLGKLVRKTMNDWAEAQLDQHIDQDDPYIIFEARPD